MASFGTPGSGLVGYGAPLGAGGLGRVLGKGGGDEGRDDPPPAFPGMGKGIALEVNPAPLPGGAKNLRDGSLDALVRIADDQLYAPQAAPRQLAQELRPDWLGLGVPISKPKTSCRPSVLTPMAMMTATESKPLLRHWSERQWRPAHRAGP